MKAATDNDYTLVLDAGQNPTIKIFTTRTDAKGGLITPGHYYFTIKSRNIVGTSLISSALDVNVPLFTSADFSVALGNGLASG